MPGACSISGIKYSQIGIVRRTYTEISPRSRLRVLGKILFLHYTCTMSDSAEENPIQTPRGFTFNKEQLKLLQSHIPAIQSADGKKERHKMIKVARKEVMALPVSKALPAEKRQELTVAVNS